MLFDALISISTLIFCFVTALFLLSLIIRRNDIADVAWGLGILLVSAASYVSTDVPTTVQSILLALCALWGIRLATRIGRRNAKKSEDPRYKKWRDAWGNWFVLRSYVQVFLLQGALMVIIGYPFIHAHVYGEGVTVSVFTILGVLIWVTGYYFEVVGDRQLDAFLMDPAHKGQIMQAGLWKYSRHPNYFGEVVMWWGIWLIVAPLPLGYVAIISPLVITFLILKVSGIPMAEERLVSHPAWKEYAARTSAFFPLPPRRMRE